jgi:hypothetical protein
LNNGTQFSPYQTFDKAASVAVSGQRILAAAGTYGGSDFTMPIPDGVTVDRSGTTGTVIFHPTASRSLVFAGSGVLSNVQVQGFYAPLAATAGTQTVTNVTSVTPQSSITVTGSANMTLNQCSINGTFTASGIPLIVADSTSTLHVNGGSYMGDPSSCSSSVLGTGIQGKDSSTVTIMNGSFSQYFNFAVEYRGNGSLTMQGTQVTFSCGYVVSFQNMQVGGTATLTNISLAGVILGGGSGALSVRGSTFTGAYALAIVTSASPLMTYDFGTAGSPGGNHFENTTSKGILIFGGAPIVDASGNTWVPNNQGSDAQGHYTVGLTSASPSVMGSSTSGRNMQVGGTAVVRL